MTDLDELERLLAEATPGEWKVAPYYTGTGPDEVCRGMLAVDDDWPTGIISENDPPLGESLSDDLDLIVALRNAAPALIAELKALRINAKANNDLARMYKAQADELRGKCAALADTLDYIAPSLPVLRDMLKRAKMPRGANTAADMGKACEAALAQYRRATAMSELIASTADEYGVQNNGTD